MSMSAPAMLHIDAQVHENAHRCCRWPWFMLLSVVNVYLLTLMAWDETGGKSAQYPQIKPPLYDLIYFLVNISNVNTFS